MPQNPPTDDPHEAGRKGIGDAVQRSTADNLRIDIDNLARLYLNVQEKLDANGDLSVDEKRIIRKILDERQRRAWLWASMRIWGGWFVATVTFYTLTREWVNKIIKAVFVP